MGDARPVSPPWCPAQGWQLWQGAGTRDVLPGAPRGWLRAVCVFPAQTPGLEAELGLHSSSGHAWRPSWGHQSQGDLKMCRCGTWGRG